MIKYILTARKLGYQNAIFHPYNIFEIAIAAQQLASKFDAFTNLLNHLHWGRDDDFNHRLISRLISLELILVTTTTTQNSVDDSGLKVTRPIGQRIHATAGVDFAFE